LISDFLSKSRSSFIVLIVILLLRLLNNYLLWILRLSLRILVELWWIVSWLRRCGIVVNWLTINLILNRLVLISLGWRKWSTLWVIWRLSKLWRNWIFNCNRNFLLFWLLFRRWCFGIIDNYRLLLINYVSSSLSSNALNNTKTEAKSHAGIKRNHGCTCCKIIRITVITWIITNIILIIIISSDILIAAYLPIWTVVIARTIFSISNFWLIL
jgi:hypothetical protein